MKERTGWLVACAGCLLAGAVSGWWWASANEPSPQLPSTQPTPMVCVDAPMVARPTASREEADLRLNWCLAQLEALQAQQRDIRQGWPTGRTYDENERPDMWTPTIEKVWQDCDLPGELLMTDCSEPPCVGVVRASDGAALEEALSGCISFDDAFPDPEVGLVPASVPCGDGRVDRMWLLTTFDEDQRQAYFDDLGMGAWGGDSWMDHELNVLFEGYRILGRRVDALQRFWECPEN